MTPTADLLAEIDAEIAVQERRFRECAIEAARLATGLVALRKTRASLSAEGATVKPDGWVANTSDRIEVLLRDHGPLHYREIQAMLADQGFCVKQGSVASAISLAEPGRFRRVSRAVYGLAEKSN